jgi:hypothetical protein
MTEQWRPVPSLQGDAPAWSGEGWRCWRVVETARGTRLRNPWTNSNLTVLWEPWQVQRADCFWRCSDRVSARCSCGIRSMSTLEHLAAFLRREGEQLRRHPLKATVVGRVAVGGRIERQIPGLTPKPGYQRSEYATLIGPLYVSPLGADHLQGLQWAYGGMVAVHPPAVLPEQVGQQLWLVGLARQEAAL